MVNHTYDDQDHEQVKVNNSKPKTVNHEPYVQGLAEVNMRKEINPKQIKEIFSGPSQYVNQIFISVDNCGMARITFGEVVPELNEIAYRASVSMPVVGLMSLRQSIEHTINNQMNIQRQMQAQEEERALRESNLVGNENE